MYAHKPTSESLNPAASPAIHTSIHEDSKSLLNNRTAKVHIFYYTCAPLQSDE